MAFSLSCRNQLKLQHVGDDLLTVASGLEGDVDPVVEAVGGLEDELVEAAVVGYPGQPLTGKVFIGMYLTARPHLGGKSDVDCLTGHVLTGGGAAHGTIEHGTTVARGNDERRPPTPLEGETTR